MGWPTTFATLAGGNQPLSIFDTMFAQVAQMIAIPSVAAGQNSLTLSPIGNAPILTSYTEFCAFRYKAVQTSNALMSAQFLTLPNLPIYLADGVTQAGSGNSVIGQEYVLVFSQALNSGAGGFFIEAASVPAAAIAAGGAVSGLTIVNNAGTPNTKLDIGISEVTLNNAAGQSLRFAPAGAAFTIDFTVNGLNGLDTGAIGSNQNYYIYAISNGGLLRGVASLSATYAGASAPSGYTFSKFLGAWRTTTAAANLTGGRQGGFRFQYVPGLAAAIPAALISGASGSVTTPTWTSVATTTAVPPNNIAAVNLILSFPNVASTGLGAAMAAPSNGFAAFGSAPIAPLIVAGAQTTGAGIGQGPANASQGTFVGVGPFFYASSLAGTALTVDGWNVNL